MTSACHSPIKQKQRARPWTRLVKTYVARACKLRPSLCLVCDSSELFPNDVMHSHAQKRKLGSGVLEGKFRVPAGTRLDSCSAFFHTFTLINMIIKHLEKKTNNWHYSFTSITVILNCTLIHTNVVWLSGNAPIMTWMNWKFEMNVSVKCDLRNNRSIVTWIFI